MVKTIEYKKLFMITNTGRDILQEINLLGAMGWELVGFHNDYAYFKREKS